MKYPRMSSNIRGYRHVVFSGIGQILAHHIAGGGYAAGGHKADLIPAVPGALHHPDGVAVGEGRQNRTPFPALTTTAVPAVSVLPDAVLPPLADVDVPVLPPRTRTRQVPLPEPSVTVRVACPEEMAVTRPVESTEAMPSSLLLQV